MDQYTLTVSGVNGQLAATVKKGDEVIETTPVKDIKGAQKFARATALRHKIENLPARLEQYTEHFHI